MSGFQSGYLTALLDRSAGPLPVLERRPRALFEPAVGQPAAAPGQADADAGRVADGNASAVAEATPPGATRRSWPDTRFEDRSPTAEAGSAHPYPDRAGAAQGSDTLRDADTRLPSAPAPDARPPADVRASIAPAGLRPSMRADTARAEAAAREADEAIEASSLTATLRVAPGAARGASPAADRTRIAAVGTPVLPGDGSPGFTPAATAGLAPLIARPALEVGGTLSRPRTDAASAPHPVPRPAPVSRRESASAAPPAAVAPPVHISIGRVEVRVTSAAPPAARASRPAAPQLSLEDYLRRRHGGRR